MDLFPKALGLYDLLANFLTEAVALSAIISAVSQRLQKAQEAPHERI